MDERRRKRRWKKERKKKKNSKYIRYFFFIDVKIFLRRLYVSCRCIYRSKAVFSSGKPEKNANTDDGQCWTGDRISARLRPSCERRWRFFLLFFLFFSFLYFSFLFFSSLFCRRVPCFLNVSNTWSRKLRNILRLIKNERNFAPFFYESLHSSSGLNEIV